MPKIHTDPVDVFLVVRNSASWKMQKKKHSNIYEFLPTKKRKSLMPFLKVLIYLFIILNNWRSENWGSISL
jgi:hypothetical protein